MVSYYRYAFLYVTAHFCALAPLEATFLTLVGIFHSLTCETVVNLAIGMGAPNIIASTLWTDQRSDSLSVHDLT